MAFRLNSDDQGPVAEINITPLVDVMLVLLVIFMVTLIQTKTFCHHRIALTATVTTRPATRCPRSDRLRCRMAVRSPHRFVRLLGSVGVALACAWSASASAHFILVAPDANRAQDASGSPQKAPPCGEEGTITASMKVTGYKAGDNVNALQAAVISKGLTTTVDTVRMKIKAYVTPMPVTMVGEAHV